MDDDFCAQNMTLVTINNVKYWLYNHILVSMSIFKVLSDCGTNSMPDITWNISTKNVNVVLHIINNDMIKPENNLSGHIEIIGFMKYLGVTTNIMREFIASITNGSIVEYIDACSIMQYDDVMMFIFDNYFQWYLCKYIITFCEGFHADNLKENFKKMINKLISPHFPIIFQQKVINTIIFRNIPGYYGYQSGDIVMMRRVSEMCLRFDCGEYEADALNITKKYMLNSYVDKSVFEIVTDYITKQLLIRNNNIMHD